MRIRTGLATGRLTKTKLTKILFKQVHLTLHLNSWYEAPRFPNKHLRYTYHDRQRVNNDSDYVQRVETTEFLLTESVQS